MFAVEIATMPALSPSSWAFHKPANSSPLSFSSPPRGASPLSPASGNSRRNAFSSPPDNNSKLFRFSNRPTKPNPLLRRREEGQAARRTLFLKNVKSRSDDKRWQKRSIEGHAVRNWYEEEKEFARLKAMDQTAVFSEADIEEASMHAATRIEEPQQVDNADEIMVDDIARQEEMEMEALLASLADNELQEPARQPQHEQPSPSYFDDDDDYDQIFMELIQDGDSQSTHSQDVMEMC